MRARGASTPESRCARGPPCTRTRSRFEAPSCRGKVHRVACNMWRLPMLGACAPAQVTLGACRRVRRASRTARTACLTCLSARPVRKSRYVSPVSPSPSPEHSSRTPSREPPTHARRRLRHIRYVHPPPSWGHWSGCARSRCAGRRRRPQVRLDCRRLRSRVDTQSGADEAHLLVER